MVLFMQAIVANGDEFFISVAFRAMYMVGLALAPIFIFWRRWKAMAAVERTDAGRPSSLLPARSPRPPRPSWRGSHSRLGLGPGR